MWKNFKLKRSLFRLFFTSRCVCLKLFFTWKYSLSLVGWYGLRKTCFFSRVFSGEINFGFFLDNLWWIGKEACQRNPTVCSKIQPSEVNITVLKLEPKFKKFQKRHLSSSRVAREEVERGKVNFLVWKKNLETEKVGNFDFVI